MLYTEQVNRKRTMDHFSTTTQIEETFPPEQWTVFPSSMSTEEFFALWQVKTEEAEAAEREITVDELRRLKSPSWTWTPPTF